MLKFFLVGARIVENLLTVVRDAGRSLIVQELREVLAPLFGDQTRCIVLKPAVSPDVWVLAGIDDLVALEHDVLLDCNFVPRHVDVDSIHVTVETDRLLTDEQFLDERQVLHRQVVRDHRDRRQRVHVVQSDLITDVEDVGCMHRRIADVEDPCHADDLFRQSDVLVVFVLLRDLVLQVVLGRPVEVVVSVVLESFVDAVFDLVVVDVDLDDWIPDLAHAVVFERLSRSWNCHSSSLRYGKCSGLSDPSDV